LRQLASGGPFVSNHDAKVEGKRHRDSRFAVWDDLRHWKKRGPLIGGAAVVAATAVRAGPPYRVHEKAADLCGVRRLW
jgi:hypothetical protein